MASFDNEYPQDKIISYQRRVFLLLGISAVPLLHLQAFAAEIPPNSFEVVSRGKGFATIFLSPRNRNKELKSKTSKLPQDPVSEDRKGSSISNVQAEVSQEQENSSQDLDQSELQETLQEAPRISTPVHEAPGISFASLLNIVGILVSGVLGALYATSKKEKSAMESTIKSMLTKISEKEAATAVMKETFQKKLLNEQEERVKQVKRLEEEKASLSSKLDSANGRIEALGRELWSEKELVDESIEKLGQLESAIVKTEDDKKQLEDKLTEKMATVQLLQDRLCLLTSERDEKEKRIETLNYSIAEKESESQTLSSMIDQTSADLSQANSTAEQLKEEILKIKKEVHSKQSSIDDLTAKIKSSQEEKNEISKKLHDLTKEYNDFKASSEEQAALDSQFLSKKECELRLLEEKLAVTLSEARSKQAMLSELEKERDDMKGLLEKEVNNVKELKDELQSTKETLEASKLEASGLAKEINENKRSYELLKAEASKLQDEFHEANELLVSNLEDQKSSSEALSSELVSTREVLKSTKEELNSTSLELQAVMEDRENIKKELLLAYKKVEMVGQELKEERAVVATLNREMDMVGEQMLKDSEARRGLEADLDEATKSLDEMNKSALLLSRELENSNSGIASLEAEKEMLFQSVMKQKDKAKEARENIEDAQNLIKRLGSERESSEKRAQKLEEELSSAKGEILRLRRHISLNKKSVEEHQPKTNDVVSGTLAVKKTASRRRKGGSSVDTS